MSEESFVIPRDNLMEAGFVPREVENQCFYTKIKGFGELKRFLTIAKYAGVYRERYGEDGVEFDPGVQQVVMYGFVLNKDGRFLLYQRTNEEKNYAEKRLAGKVSIGIGGHMEPTDLTLAKSFYRELDEEAEITIDGNPVNFRDRDGVLDIHLMKQYVRISPVGFIKDERDEVGKVHFGVICRIKPKADNIEIHVKTGDEQESINFQYITPTEYIKMQKSGAIIPEGWTDTIFQEEIKPNLRPNIR